MHERYRISKMKILPYLLMLIPHKKINNFGTAVVEDDNSDTPPPTQCGSGDAFYNNKLDLKERILTTNPAHGLIKSIFNLFIDDANKKINLGIE